MASTENGSIDLRLGGSSRPPASALAAGSRRLAFGAAPSRAARPRRLRICRLGAWAAASFRLCRVGRLRRRLAPSAGLRMARSGRLGFGRGRAGGSALADVRSGCLEPVPAAVGATARHATHGWLSRRADSAEPALARPRRRHRSGGRAPAPGSAGAGELARRPIGRDGRFSSSRCRPWRRVARAGEPGRARLRERASVLPPSLPARGERSSAPASSARAAVG